MKNKSSLYLIVALAVIVLILVLQNMSSDKISVSESLAKLYPDFNTSSVNMIKVYKVGYPDSGLVFSKEDGNWIINNYYDASAKDTEIDNLLSDITSLQGEVRSMKSELLAEYEIGDEIALHLEFLSGDASTIVHALVGKGVPQQAQAGFVRNNGSDTVYLVNNNFLSRFAAWNAEPSKKLPAKRWANLKITDLDKEQIEKLEIQNGKTTYKFEKNEIPPVDSTAEPTYNWVQVAPTKGKVLDDMKIKPIVNRVARMTASEIVGTEVKDGFGLTDSKYRSIVTTSDDQVITLTFGAESDTTTNSRYIMANDKPVIYEAAKYNYESVFINPFKDE